MYRFRERFKDMVKMGKERKVRMDDLSELTGISYIFLIQILNRKQDCSYPYAFTITKCLNPHARVEQYFEKIK